MITSGSDNSWCRLDFDRAFSQLYLSMLTRGAELVVVVGAGASIESGVPLGDAITANIGNVLSDLRKSFVREDKPDTLEAFLDYVSTELPGNAQPMIARLLADIGVPRAHSLATVPTLLHMLVARLAANGIARLIISLNFDELLERCLEAELGPPGTLSESDNNRDTRWISLSTTEEQSRIDSLLCNEIHSASWECVVLKPHGTISVPDSLVAAERDVLEFQGSVKNALARYLRNRHASFLFLGCSFRDSDFFNLYRETKGIRASFYILDCKPLASWLANSRDALRIDSDMFTLESFAGNQVFYAECSPDVSLTALSPPADSESAESGQYSSAVRELPAQALLAIASRASLSTGNLKERNAPWTTDILLHDLIRKHVVGKQQGLRSFLATEMLMEAARENGVFSRERIKTLRHLRVACDAGFESLVDEIINHCASTGVLVRAADDEFALCRIRSVHLVESLSSIAGPFRSAVDQHELAHLLLDLAENKATRSNWTTAQTNDLVSIENATRLVLDTTDGLSVLSEYGTWMRRERFVATFTDAVRRATEAKRRVLVIVASPPPISSHGYIEWIVSCLWLNRYDGVSLFIMDYKTHDHHMNLGQQMAIDFKRQGTSNQLHESKIRFGYADTLALEAQFADCLSESVGFDEWQFTRGLHLGFGAFAIQYLLPKTIPLDRVRLVHEPQWDASVPDAMKARARKEWNGENERRRATGRPLLDAKPLFRPVTAKRLGDDLVVGAGRTTYFDNFALQTQSKRWDNDTILGAGISVVPVCSDGNVLLGRRSRVVASGTGKYHVAGGHAHPDDTFHCSPAELSSAAYEELYEEMRMAPGDIRELRFVGLGIDLLTSKPEFIVKAMLKEDADGYIRRWNVDVAEKDGPEGCLREFTELVTLSTVLSAEGTRATASAEGPFCIAAVWEARHRVVPACQAALMAVWLSDERSDVEEIEGYLA